MGDVSTGEINSVIFNCDFDLKLIYKVEEYDQKPGLAPPLVIIELAFKLVKAIWKKTCRKKKENCEKK